VGTPRIAALADALVHSLDIRRPLHRPSVISAEAFGPTAGWLVGMGWPLSGSVSGRASKRVRGLRLVADDAGWTHGVGPEVHGPAEAMLLMLTGRKVGRDELSGPGAPELYERL